MKRRRPDWGAWPSIRAKVELFPWHWRWRPWLYADDTHGARALCSAQWLFLTVEWWGQDTGPLFPLDDPEG